MKWLKEHKGKVLIAVFACMLGISMLGVGVAAAAGVFNWSGTATVRVVDNGGTVSMTYDTPSVGSWNTEGTVWTIGDVEAGTTQNAVVRVTNTHTHAFTLVATNSVATSCGVTASWYYYDSGWVSYTTSLTLGAGVTIPMQLSVVVPSGAPEGCTSTVTMGIDVN